MRERAVGRSRVMRVRPLFAAVTDQFFSNGGKQTPGMAYTACATIIQLYL